MIRKGQPFSQRPPKQGAIAVSKAETKFTDPPPPPITKSPQPSEVPASAPGKGKNRHEPNNLPKGKGQPGAAHGHEQSTCGPVWQGVKGKQSAPDQIHPWDAKLSLRHRGVGDPHMWNTALRDADSGKTPAPNFNCTNR